MAAHTARRLPARGRARRRRAGEHLGRGAARPRALGRLPQRRHARPQQRVRPGRGRHRLPPPPAAAAAAARRVQPRAHGASGSSLALGLPPRLPGGSTPSASCCRVAVLGPAAPAQGGGRRRLADQHVGLRHPDAVRRLGRDRAAARRGARARAARLLPAVRGAVSAHPALPARGGHPPRRPHARLRARRPPKPRRGARRGRGAGVRPLRRGRRSGRVAVRRAGRLALGRCWCSRCRAGPRCCSPGGDAGRAWRPADHQRGMYRALGGLGCHRPRRGARAGAPDAPLAAASTATYTSPLLIRPGDGMHSAVEPARGPRPDRHPFDRARRGQAGPARGRGRPARLAGVPTADERRAPDRAASARSSSSAWRGSSCCPGLWTRPRTIEGIAGAAGIGLGAPRSSSS